MNYSLGPKKGSAADVADKTNDPTVTTASGEVLLKNRTRANLRTYIAIAMILGAFCFLWFATHNLQDWVNGFPLIIMMFPFMGFATIGAILPLVMFVSFQDDFGRLNPLIPSHYWLIAKKTYKAFTENNFKVSAKDM